MPTWTFIRHGQSVANAEGWFAGQRDAPLTELGRSQALAARDAMQGLRFDRALCSDLSRAAETAAIIVDGRGPRLEISAALRERSCGSWEGRRIADLEAAGVMSSFSGWHGRPGGGESLHDVAARVCRLFATLPETDSTLVVSHGALMRAVLGTLDERPEHELGLWHPSNCEVVEREVTAERWQTLASRLSRAPL